MPDAQGRPPSELSPFVRTLLAWEGAILAGLFVAALANVAVGIYMHERFDERVRSGAGGGGAGWD